MMRVPPYDDKSQIGSGDVQSIMRL